MDDNWAKSSGILSIWAPKNLAYSAPITDLEVLQQEAENACQGIIVKPEIFGKVLTSV
jgi:hypothetical protein